MAEYHPRPLPHRRSLSDKEAVLESEAFLA